MKNFITKIRLVILLTAGLITFLAIGCKKDDKDSYNLREKGPGGGYIFYINPNYLEDGWKYLEAAPLSTEWDHKIFGKMFEEVGGTSVLIGTGKNNTDLIVAFLNTDPPVTGTAAQLCKNLVFGGYDDWFLPSKDELNRMYVNLKSGTDENGVAYTPVGGFGDESYLSSSESEQFDSPAAHVWFQNFTNGVQLSDGKDADSRSVRAIRAF